MDQSQLQEMIAAAKKARAARAIIARHDINTFIPFVMRDEESGKSITQAPYHSEWQDLCNEQRRLVLWSHVEAGKTQQLGIGRTLWELGRNPSLRFVIVGATAGQSGKITETIARYIKESEELKLVFPHLKPGPIWARSYFTVERDSTAKDPSVQAIGLHAAILGARIDRLILDDCLTYETCRTDYMRKDTLEWIESTLFGRLTAKSKVIFVGNAWHHDDAMHQLSRRKGWDWARYSILDDSGTSIWPSHWPMPRIEAKRDELGPLEFARQMLCRPRADEESRFKREWIEACMVRGENKTFRDTLDVLPEGCQTFTGVDLGVKQTLGANVSCVFTIMVHPDDSREVLNIESGKWTAPEIIEKLASTHKRYKSTIFVDSNAAQDFIVQFINDQDSRIPVRRFHTGSNKMHPEYGVESIGAELAGEKWIIPSYKDETGTLRGNKEVQQWVDQMLYYDPKGHTGDHLMACWFAKEGARRSTFRYRTAVIGGSGHHESMPSPHTNEPVPQYRTGTSVNSEIGKQSDPAAAQVWEDLHDLIEDNLP